MDLVVPDAADSLWGLIGFVLLFLPIIVAAVIGVMVTRSRRRRNEEPRAIGERVIALERHKK